MRWVRSAIDSFVWLAVAGLLAGLVYVCSPVSGPTDPPGYEDSCRKYATGATCQEIAVGVFGDDLARDFD